MSDYNIYFGNTSKTIYFQLRDSTTGLAKAGLNAAACTAATYTPTRGVPVSFLPLDDGTIPQANDPYSDSFLFEVNATTAPGLYRLDVPDGAWASGDYVVITVQFAGTIEESTLIGLTTPPAEANVVTWLGNACQISESGAESYPSVVIRNSSGAGGIQTSQGQVLDVGTVNNLHADAVADIWQADKMAYANQTNQMGEAILAGGAGPWTQATAGSGLSPLATGASQGSSSAFNVVLDAGATFANDILNGAVIKMIGGASDGQHRVIYDYDSLSQTALVSPDWIVWPQNTDAYEIVDGSVNAATQALTPLGTPIVLTDIVANGTPPIDGQAVTDTRTDVAAIKVSTDEGGAGPWGGGGSGGGSPVASVTVRNNALTVAYDKTAGVYAKSDSAGSTTTILMPLDTSENLFEAAFLSFGSWEKIIHLVTIYQEAILGTRDITADQPIGFIDIKLSNDAISEARTSNLGIGVVQDATNDPATITLQASTPFGNGAIVGASVGITSGTGAGQMRLVIANTGNVATVDRNWGTLPNDGTSTYQGRMAIVNAVAQNGTTPKVLGDPITDQDLFDKTLEALNDSITELGVAAPQAEPGLRDAVMCMYMALRNSVKVTTTGTDSLEIHDSAGTKITSKVLNDTGADYEEETMT